MEKTIQDLEHEIQITTQQLTYEKDNEAKQRLIKKIQKLRFEKEIAQIKKKIDTLR